MNFNSIEITEAKSYGKGLENILLESMQITISDTILTKEIEQMPAERIIPIKIPTRCGDLVITLWTTDQNGDTPTSRSSGFYRGSRPSQTDSQRTWTEKHGDQRETPLPPRELLVTHPKESEEERIRRITGNAPMEDKTQRKERMAVDAIMFPTNSSLVIRDAPATRTPKRTPRNRRPIKRVTNQRIKRWWRWSWRRRFMSLKNQ